jgi:hypothetical protein
MKYYAMAEMDITDPSWVRASSPEAQVPQA